MKNKKITSLGLAITVMATTMPAYATEYKEATQETENADVYLSKQSTYTITIPKTIVLDGETNSGQYTVTVDGNLSGTEIIKVVPDETFAMSQEGKDDISAAVDQDKTEWAYDEMETVGNGTIQVDNATAGDWHGSFNFNISLESSSEITVTSKDGEGNDLNATASEIIGTKKETLLNNLEETGMISSTSKVDALIEVKSDNFEGMANTTFNVSSIAKEGDKVAILHFDETKQEWEYIGTRTVDAEGNISANFSSYSPVAFVKIEENNYEKIEYTSFVLTADNYAMAGIEREGDVVIPSTFEYEGVKYKITEIGSSAFNSCKNLYSVVIPEGVTHIGYSSFEYCEGLLNIYIPESVTYINRYAFASCTNLGYIRYSGTDAQWEEITKAPSWNDYCTAKIAMNSYY